jgi:hypothetical protein
MNATGERPRLFGDILRKPICLVWTMLLPQLLLLALNLLSWHLVAGEMSEYQKNCALAFGACEIGLLAGGALAFGMLQHAKKGVGWLIAVAMILVHGGYLWFFTACLDQLLPANVPDWILAGSDLIYYQYALLMPAIFYAGIRLVSFELPLRPWSDFGITLAALILLPAGWYLLFALGQSLLWRSEIPALIGILFFAGSTLILLLAFLRVLLLVYAWVSRIGHGRIVLLALVGLAAPIGGLLLNKSIPFPYYFQDLWIYIFAVLNGLILLIPTPPAATPRAILWYLRALTFPFALYFFVVFLPFLPLALLAILAFGAGFLILAPTLLFVIQIRLMFDEGRRLAAQKGRLFVLAILAAGLLTIPAGYTCRALVDRQSLLEAVNAIFNRDADTTRVECDPQFALRALERLRDRKTGIQLPFISDYYHWLVFKGMVLPDHKIAAIEQALGRTEPVAPERDRNFSIADIFGSRVRSRATAWSGAPPRHVELREARAASGQPTGDLIKTRLQLQLRNGAENVAEFVTEIDVPDGVLVTGYGLDIGTNSVPGRLFEKKTALWVYHMIRDQIRRDPGLLVYQDDHRLKLSVYPFQANEERKTEIEFTFPAALDPEIRLGARAMRLQNPTPTKATGLRLEHTNSVSFALPGTLVKSLPPIRRTPYLHFILDCSAQAAGEWRQYGARLNREIARFPEAKMCRLTAVNYELADLTDRLIPVGEATQTLAAEHAKLLPFRGALCPGYAIKHGVFEFAAKSEWNGEPLVPIFIVIKAGASTPVLPDDLAAWDETLPDVPAWYLSTPDGFLEAFAFAGASKGNVERAAPPEPVVLFRCGNEIQARRPDADALLSFRDNPAPILCFNPTARRFEEIAGIRSATGAGGYGAAMSLWLDWRAAMIRPSTLNASLADLVDKSRDLNTLIPLTAFIVVENSAQWNILALKEKQAVQTDRNLEFDEFHEQPTSPPGQVPAPGIWLLLPVGIFLLWRRARKNQTNQ